MKKPRVTIGIPVYNEEANISQLLEQLLAQKQSRFKLTKIVVVSDGSTDMTVTKVRAMKSPLIKIHASKVRRGQAQRQNEIIQTFRGDILVLLNGDVLPAGNRFLESLVKPIISDKFDLVSGKRIPLPPNSFLESVLNLSIDIKNLLYEQKESSVYLCNGSVRAFSKRLVQKLRFPYSVGEDAFSYFFTKSLGFAFTYVPQALVYYRTPASLVEHLHQSVRFFHSQEKMRTQFGDAIVDEYHYPKSVILKTAIEFYLSSPLRFSTYALVYCTARLMTLFSKSSDHVWEIARTSKKLV